MPIDTEADETGPLARSEVSPAHTTPTLPLASLPPEAPPAGMRLATRLALATAALLVACLGLALAFATWRANDVTRRKIEDNLKAVPAIYKSFEGAEASARRQQVRSLADQPGTKALLAEAAASPDTCHDSAVDFARSLGAGVVFLFDARGALLARSDRGVGEGTGRDFSAVTWVKEPLTAGVESSAYILEVSRGRSLLLVASAPVVQGAGRERVLNGVLAAGFPIDDGRAAEVGSLMSGEAAFLGNVGGRAGPPEAAVVAATHRLEAVPFHAVLGGVGALDALLGKGEPAGPFEFAAAGGDQYVATALPIKSGGGEPIAALVVARSKDAELAPFRQIRRGIVWTGLLVLLVSLPASVALARRISQPIVQLAQGAEAIRGGQLDIALPGARGDEVGTLARAFAAMVAELKQKAALEAWVAEILRRPGDVTMAGRLMPVGQPSAAGLGVGKLFAKRYYVLSVLGQGGMGTVYRVQDRELDEEVALKVLLEHAFGPEMEAVEVLKQETRLARSITHPNVVRVFDLGESEGTYFLTMEYVPGTTLTELLERRGPLDMAPGLQIAKQVCRGLAAVHKAGVIHGDLKPRNVMVMASGVVKLMDFGVARGTRLGQKQEGMMGGSLHYMSPEQARGAELDPQSDLYSAGVTFYEMFTGERPFESDDRAELRRTHLYEQPPDPRTKRSDMPDLLAQVILACLEKSRVKRPPTASDLERALLRIRV
jgi:serine/threonine-protein kinase